MAVLYEDRFKGGVTVAGASPPKDFGGTFTFSVSIPSATGIRKAYLIAGRCGAASNIAVSLNNGFNTQNYTFDNTNQVSANFFTNFQGAGGNLSGVHAIDVTADISPSVSNYTLTIPAQTPTIQRYTDFALAIAWDNLGMDIVDTQWYINDSNMASILHYNLSFMIPMDNSKPVGMSLMTGYICNDNTVGNGSHDPENISVNSTLLGHIGSTTGDQSCGGAYISPLGNFSYSNSALTAGANCNTNQVVSGLDALSNIQALVGANATAYGLDFNSLASGNNSNNLWAIFTTYTDTTPYAFPYETVLCDSSFATTNITQTTADLSWLARCINPQPAVNISNVQYRTVGSPTWIQSPNNPVALSDTLTGLTANTQYEWQIINLSTDGAIAAPSRIFQFTTLP